LGGVKLRRKNLIDQRTPYRVNLSARLPIERNREVAGVIDLDRSL
jgi:hypothetical protein